MKRVLILDEKLHHELQILAIARKQSVHDVAKTLLAEAINNMKRPRATWPPETEKRRSAQ
jgi:hypothetical protein